MRLTAIALVLFVLAGFHGAELLNADLYLSNSRRFDSYLAALPARSLDPLAPFETLTSRLVGPPLSEGYGTRKSTN